MIKLTLFALCLVAIAVLIIAMIKANRHEGAITLVSGLIMLLLITAAIGSFQATFNYPPSDTKLGAWIKCFQTPFMWLLSIVLALVWSFRLHKKRK